MLKYETKIYLENHENFSIIFLRFKFHHIFIHTTHFRHTNHYTTHIPGMDLISYTRNLQVFEVSYFRKNTSFYLFRSFLRS